MYEWRAVGVHCRVVSSAPLALDVLVQQVETWEQTLSRFRPDSELNRLNRQRRMRVSATLHAVLLAALEVAQWSNGLVVPSLGQHISASGYDRTFAAVPADQPSAIDPLVVPDWRAIVVNGRDVSLPPHLLLDLAGVAKGWMAARLVALYAPPHGRMLVQIGGDIAVTAPDAQAAWCVAVDHPFQAMPAGHIALFEGSVATSSVHERRWRRAGVPVHHIIDPRTSLPAVSDVATATVIAMDAHVAEAAAKVVLIMGRHAGLTWLTSHGLPGLVIDAGGVTH
ncbi:MAG: FAD:protein FMN transferase, partial [Roseiflexaceae bacterium]